MINYEQARDELDSLLQNRGFQSSTAQVQAKALLSEIATEIPDYEWTYNPNRLIRNITFGTSTIQNIAIEHQENLASWESASRRFAIIWEALGELNEKTDDEIAFLNSAFSFELAGYQANSAYLAKQVESRLSHADQSLQKISTLFLQRKLLSAKRFIELYQDEPEFDEQPELSIYEAMGNALFAKSLGLIANYLLLGFQDNVSNAEERLQQAEALFSAQGLVEQANLTKSIRSLVPTIVNRSTWHNLLRFAPNNSKWQRYIKLLARGLDRHVIEGRSISELWPSQIHSIESGLLDSNANKIIRMPTSAGKTRIAEMAIVFYLISNPNSKAIFVAPFRALVSELANSFLTLLSDLGFRVSTITGSYELDDFELSLFHETDLLVTTPEKLDLILRAQPEFLEDVDLYVFDEAQIVDDQIRGLKAELLIAKLQAKFEEARFLLLSAVVPQETLEDFAAWLHSTPNEDIVSLEWRPSIQRYARFSWIGVENLTGIIRYSSSDEPSLLQEFVSGIIDQKVFRFENPKTGRINTRKFPEVGHKAQIASELAFKFADSGPVLIFCPQTNLVDSVAKACLQRLELLQLSEQPIPQFTRKTSTNRSSILAREWLGDHFYCDLLEQGIGIHHGNLPDDVRNSIELDFKQNKLQILIATNTLAQGVNLPVKTVIVHSCWRYVDGGRERVSARDYWNIAGRAGRAGKETEGLVIHLTLNPRDYRDYQYYENTRFNVEPVKSALYEYLLALTQERLTEDTILDEIDSEILGILVEEVNEGDDNPLESLIERIFEQSLGRVQAERNDVPTGQLVELLKKAANHINEVIPNEGTRKVYGSTGLSSESCLSISSHIENNAEQIRSLLLNMNQDSLEESLELMLQACIELPEMQSTREFGGSYNGLLTAWVSGKPINEIVAQFADQIDSAEDLGRFIDDLFRYRLPWGFSSYIRIALNYLDINSDEVSEYAKFLPSMIKYGLPDPISCWVKSVGIPMRTLSINLATTFLNENQEPSYRLFLQWIGLLDSERLRYEFSLESPLLEDVSRIISISGYNPLLRDSENLEGILPIETRIAGIMYDNRLIEAQRIRLGDEINLSRDYDNLIDRNAITINKGAIVLGYLPRQIAQVLAPEMDVGNRFRAEIIEIQEIRIPEITIQVSQEI